MLHSSNLLHPQTENFKQRSVSLTFCSLMKAFDTKSQSIISQKLQMYGIGAQALKTNYFSPISQAENILWQSMEDFLV